ncbi:MAG: hypothetical protein OJF51_004637 [Nitrospira sp.]|nr:MAG: hypothetical protein OJF51_004637 [Nitrospira sp.]
MTDVCCERSESSPSMLIEECLNRPPQFTQRVITKRLSLV